MLYPFTFRPICMERVWGGRRLAELFGKELPPEVPIGETWEISDRPEAISEITNEGIMFLDLWAFGLCRCFETNFNFVFLRQISILFL